MARTPVRRLYVGAVDAQHVDHEWGFGEWERAEDYAEAVRCDECGRAVLHSSDHKRGCENADRDANDMDAEGPMMYGYWPCEIDDADEAARLLVDLPLCPVMVNGEWVGLALTGGGMDLSWEIAEAYTLLGYLPPAALDLPMFAGMRLDTRHRYIVAAMRRSCRVVRDWQIDRLQRLARTVESMKARAGR